jgi:hypothetical protein
MVMLRHLEGKPSWSQRSVGNFAHSPRVGAEQARRQGRRAGAAGAARGPDRRWITRRNEERPQLGDHIISITDMAKFRSRYPAWRLTSNREDILEHALREPPPA